MSQAENGNGLKELLQIMRMLRDPEHGCPWDLQQSFASIAPHTLEEAYEVLDAIESGDHAQLRSELGDLLFQVVFYTQLGHEQGLFDFDSVAQAISNKLLHRHPHVFPEGTVASFGQAPKLDAEGVVRQWEEIKVAERKAGSEGKSSALDDVPLALTALMRAAKLQKRVASQGLDWASAQEVLPKLDEEIRELKVVIAENQGSGIREEFGDLLFTMVNLGRHLGLDSESCLREANRKFESRVRAIEDRLGQEGRKMEELATEELEQYWKEVKHALKEHR